MIKGLLAFAVWVCSFGFVSNYSSTWDEMVHPAKGVEVTLKSGQVVSGDLYRDWRGDWVLTRPGGTEFTFPNEATASMAFPRRAESIGFFSRWRSWGPLVLLGALSLLYLLRPILPGLRKFRGGLNP